MASQGNTRYSGPDSMEALIADREKTWSGFTTATTGVVVFMAVLLIGMAVFLL
jgi:hypothetical protein